MVCISGKGSAGAGRLLFDGCGCAQRLAGARAKNLNTLPFLMKRFNKFNKSIQ
jgi:hypothetical protein